MELETVADYVGDETNDGYGEGNSPSVPGVDESILHVPGEEWEEWAGAGTAAGAPSVDLRDLVLHAESAHGTHVITVGLEIHNLSDWPVTEGELSLAVSANPADGATSAAENNAERNANHLVPVPAIPSRGSIPFQLPLQVDPGHWHVSATVWQLVDGVALSQAQGDVFIQGHHAHDVAFDVDAKRDLDLAVTHLTRVDTALYQVHFTLHNRSQQAVPAGLPVMGILTSEPSGETSTQSYDLPGPIAAGASIETYLTLEGAPTGTLSATILLTLNDSSSRQESLEVKAEEVQGAV